MALDTAARRGAALWFGRSGASGVSAGDGTVSDLDRGALLGCFVLESITDPCNGWIANSRSRVLISDTRETAFIPSSRNRTAIAASVTKLSIPISRNRVWIAPPSE